MTTSLSTGQTSVEAERPSTSATPGLPMTSRVFLLFVRQLVLMERTCRAATLGGGWVLASKYLEKVVHRCRISLDLEHGAISESDTG